MKELKFINRPAFPGQYTVVKRYGEEFIAITNKSLFSSALNYINLYKRFKPDSELRIVYNRSILIKYSDYTEYLNRETRVAEEILRLKQGD